MSMRNIFLGLTLAAGLANVVTLILIMAALDRRGIRTNMLVARVYTYKYLRTYREETVKETGKTGPLFRVWVISIELAFAAAILAVLSPK